MVKVVLVNGLGIGKTFVAEAMMKRYDEMGIDAVLVHLEYETHEEAARAIKKHKAAEVLILVGRLPVSAETPPWQCIQVSGGRPIFEARGVAADADQNVG